MNRDVSKRLFQLYVVCPRYADPLASICRLYDSTEYYCAVVFSKGCAVFSTCVDATFQLFVWAFYKASFVARAVAQRRRTSSSLDSRFGRANWSGTLYFLRPAHCDTWRRKPLAPEQQTSCSLYVFIVIQYSNIKWWGNRKMRKRERKKEVT